MPSAFAIVARRPALVTGFVIFVAAAALRLSLVETARFTGDEARDYATGMDIAHGVRFPALGPAIAGSSACCLPGPLYNWMAAAPQLVTRAPEAGNVFFELLGAATVWMFWFGLRRPFGERAAAFAGMLLALSPWSALFGDRVWNPHAFLFFEMLALLSVLRLRDEPRSRWAIVFPIACLALPQLHLAAPIVWLALLPLAVGNIRLWHRRYLALGTVLGLALYIPFVIHEAKTGFAVTRVVLNLSTNAASGAKSNFYLAPIYVLRLLTLDVTYHELTGYWGGLDESAAWRTLWLGSAARPFHVLRLVALMSSLLLLVSAVAVAVVSVVRRMRAKDQGRPLGAFALSAAIAIAADMTLLAVTGTKVFANYVTPVFPFVFVVYAHLAATALQGSSVWARRFATTIGVLALIVCIGGVEATLSISRRIDARNGLAVHRAVAQRVLDDCAAAGRAPQACPARLDLGFFGLNYSHAIFARHALPVPVRWERSPGGFAYRLQKRDDPPPPEAAAFPVTRVGVVSLYRLR